MKCVIPLFLAAAVVPAYAQLNIVVSAPKVSGSKAVVKLETKNTFDEPVQSAKASIFILAPDGKALGQASRWIIGGNEKSGALIPGATNHFNFVVPLHEPVTNAGLKTKVSFSRIVLKSGKVVDPVRSVTAESGGK
jgi:hypothetical protein